MHRREFLAGSLAAAMTLPPGALGRGADADVIVVGAGLAGLSAATLLEEFGARVLVVEARRRPGGRLLSLSDMPGAPEAGANVIGGGYSRVVDAATRLGVKLVEERSSGFGAPDSTLLVVNDRAVPLAQWADADVNPFRAPEWRSVAPFSVAGRFTAATNPLTSLNEWRLAKSAPLDRSAYAVMADAGFGAEEIEFALERNHGYATSAHTISMLRLWQGATWIKAQQQFGRTLYHAAGGNQRLPRAIAESLRSEPVYRSEVEAIESDRTGVVVTTRGGSRYRARFAIVTVPFSAARFVRFDPALPSVTARAIATLSYTPIFQLHAVPRRPFWESDGLPLNMWTDTLVGRVFAQRRLDDASVSSLLFFVSGRSAQYLDRLPLAQATDAVLETLYRLRPAARGQLEQVRAISWQRDRYAGGAYAAWAPGQIAAYAATMALPAGRIHFAGEHTAEIDRGMEGAMESGERAAFEVLDRL